MTQHTQLDTFPELTREEMGSLHIDWVIKPGTNDKNFNTKHLPITLQDRSIGLHYGNRGELPENVTDEQLELSHGDWGTGQRKQLKQFRNDFKIGDTIIIAQGLVECLYVAEIASSYYFHDLGDTDVSYHRRRIKNIRKIPSGFSRIPLRQTLAPYNPL